MAEVTIEAAGANRASWCKSAVDPRNYNPNLLVKICLLVHDFMWWLIGLSLNFRPHTEEGNIEYSKPHQKSVALEIISLRGKLTSIFFFLNWQVSMLILMSKCYSGLNQRSFTLVWMIENAAEHSCSQCGESVVVECWALNRKFIWLLLKSENTRKREQIGWMNWKTGKMTGEKKICVELMTQPLRIRSQSNYGCSP